VFFVYRFDVFTSPCELQLFGASKTVCDTTATTVLRRSKQLEAKYNFFDPHSFLSSINNRQTNKVKLDPQTHEILKSIEPLMARTNYVFDIAYAGTLKKCYNQSSIEAMKRCKEELLEFASHEHYELSKNHVTFSNPHTKIDLGGVVKEYAVDEAAKIIRQAKIKHALINFGGDISVVGAKPNDEAWKIGIKNPQNPSEDLFSVELTECSMTSSGHYERGVTVETRRFSHVIENKNTHSSLLQASAIHKSALTAGVFSTALLIDESVKAPSDISLHLVNDKLEILTPNSM
jgi:FAD:protein FMN transferase